MALHICLVSYYKKHKGEQSAILIMCSNSLSLLKEHKNELLIIHYSCESLNDKNEGLSPRISSIVVHNYGSNTSHSFALHLEAEIQHIKTKDAIETHYDSLEKAMLIGFFDFVKGHPNHLWLHWNMRNIHFGFELIEHRYKIHGATNKDIFRIPDDQRFNLSDLILDKYGDNAVSHPRMKKLMKLNGDIPKGFLDGEREAQAFKNKDYIILHESTLSKVGWFRTIFKQLLKNKINTEHSPWRIKLDRFLESRTIKILGDIAILATISQGVWAVFKYIS